MSGSACRTPQVSLLTSKTHIDDYGVPEHILLLNKAYIAAGASYTDMVQTEVDLAHQLAHTTNHTNRAHIATTLTQSCELQNHIFSEPALTQLASHI